MSFKDTNIFVILEFIDLFTKNLIKKHVCKCNLGKLTHCYFYSVVNIRVLTTHKKTYYTLV